MTSKAADFLIRQRWMVLFILAAIATALAYTFYTGHIWEDYFITFRFSRNLCEGHGLVYNPGEHVHGFTSPLGVLLPALAYVITGMRDYEPALWLFRVWSITAFTGAGVLVLAANRREGGPPLSGLALAILLLVDVKAVGFSTNGMETGFMLFFVAWGIYLATGPGANYLVRGLCWGGLMWTRPDGCVYIGLLAMGELVFGRQRRDRILIQQLKAAGVCALAYLPWFAWAWWYYRSPVPNTIAAKSLYIAEGYSHYLHLLGRWRYFQSAWLNKTRDMFAPFYFGVIGWPEWVVSFCLGLAYFCSLYWLLPVRDRLGRMASLIFMLLTLFNVIVPMVFPWYYPPETLFGLIVLARAIPTLTSLAGPRLRPLSMTVAAMLLAVVVAGLGHIFVASARLNAIQQRVIEDHGRKQIGLWLRNHAAPQDLVFLESLGYIGYFSERRMADWPGLVSPEVVRLRRDYRLRFAGLIRELRPAWVVMRGGREEKAILDVPQLRGRYVLARGFDVRDELNQYGEITGKGYLMLDAFFNIYRRIDSLKPLPRSDR
jgi:hypothetical protein